ncbi:MAG: hypothetical protein ACJA0W_003779 [Candidatus Azotimanducaceae bacterium]|jgi:hypothetical protein
MIFLSHHAGAPQVDTREDRPAMLSQRRALALVFVMVLGFVMLIVPAVIRDSVTIDEFAHLPVGLFMDSSHIFAVDTGNPPLSRLLLAWFSTADATGLDPGPTLRIWQLGYQFMRIHATDYQRQFILPRLAIVAATLALAALVFAWSWAWLGLNSAMLAIFFLLFSPAILAHGHLATVDLLGALGFTLTAWATWWLLRSPTLLRAVVLGASFGLAVLLKLSSVMALLGIAACSILYLRSPIKQNSISLRLVLACSGLFALTGLLVINAGYLFDGTGIRLSESLLSDSPTFGAIAQQFPGLRLPLPETLLLGIDGILHNGKGGFTYLAGNISAEPHWYYHLTTFFLKTPVAFLILLALATLNLRVFGHRDGNRTPMLYCLTIPIGLILAANIMLNSLQIGERHMLPAYPLLFMWVAHGVVSFINKPVRAIRPGLVTGIFSALLLWYLSASVLVAPRYLQYFNIAAGGQYGGHRWLADSNIDWGQDLIRLREYMTERNLKQVNLGYFGRVHPSIYGINFVPLEDEMKPGITIVSASFLVGIPYWTFTREGLEWRPPSYYSWLLKQTPTDRVGALFVYDFPTSVPTEN